MADRHSSFVTSFNPAKRRIGPAFEVVFSAISTKVRRSGLITAARAGSIWCVIDSFLPWVHLYISAAFQVTPLAEGMESLESWGNLARSTWFENDWRTFSERSSARKRGLFRKDSADVHYFDENREISVIISPFALHTSGVLGGIPT